MDQTINLPLSDVYVDGKTYTRAELNRLGRNELRPIARSVHATLRSTVSLTWLGSAANAADLRAFILRDKPDHEFGFASNGHSEPSNGSAEDALATLAGALNGYIRNSVNREAVEEIAGEIADQRLDAHKADVAQLQVTHAAHVEQRLNEVLEIAKAGTVSTRIQVQDREPITVDGLRHKAYEDLLADILAFQATKETVRANFWLVGPAGTGKTTAGKMLSKHLGLPFYFNGAIDSEYKLRGFIDAQGRVVATPFRRAYEHGGVYLFDEVDSSLPSAWPMANTTFRDRMIRSSAAKIASFWQPPIRGADLMAGTWGASGRMPLSWIGSSESLGKPTKPSKRSFAPTNTGQPTCKR
jgi:hypothetical protein